MAEAGNHSPDLLPSRPLSAASQFTPIDDFMHENEALRDDPSPIPSSSSQYSQYEVKSHRSMGSTGSPSISRHRHHNNHASLTSESDSSDKLLPGSRPTSISSTSSSSQYDSFNISPNSSSDADISSSSDPFTSSHSSTSIHHLHSHKDHHIPAPGTITLGELSGHDLLSKMTYFKPHTTLRQFINFIIENDIRLPTDEEINGDREWNAAECEYAASIPLKKKPRGYPMEERRDRDPGGRFLGDEDDLGDIGGKCLYYTDPVTGKIRMRVGRVDGMDRRVEVDFVAGKSVEEKEAADDDIAVEKMAEEEEAETALVEEATAKAEKVEVEKLVGDEVGPSAAAMVRRKVSPILVLTEDWKNESSVELSALEPKLD